MYEQDRIGRRRQMMNLIIAAMVVFVASRLLVFLLGVQFDAKPLLFFSHYIDPQLLRSAPLESLYWLHGQPPAMNAFVALILGLFPESSVPAFSLVYIGLGATLAILLLLTMRRLNVKPSIALLLTTLFMISPAAILYENWLFTTYPIAVLLVLSALFVHRFAERLRTVDAAVAFGAMAAVALLRPTYHLLWMVGVVGWLMWTTPREARRRLLAAAALPLLLVLGLYAKNAVQFGSFSASTWLGMNMARISTMNIPEAEREGMVDRGELSQLGLIPPFSPLGMYPADVADVEPTGVTVLDQQLKSASYPNFNNSAYIGISDIYFDDAVRVIAARPLVYFDDAIRVIAARPLVYFEGVGTAYLNYLLPAGDYWFQNDNREALGWYDRAFNIAVFAQVIPRDDIPREGSFMYVAVMKLLACGLVLVVLLPLLLAYGARYTFAGLKHPRPIHPSVTTVGYIIGTILFATIVANAIDTGENNRFRFELDPLWLALAAMALTAVLAQSRRRNY